MVVAVDLTSQGGRSCVEEKGMSSKNEHRHHRQRVRYSVRYIYSRSISNAKARKHETNQQA